MSDEFREAAENVAPIWLKFDADDIEELMNGETFEIMIRDRDGAADYVEVALYTKGIIGGGDMREEFERIATEVQEE